MIDRRRIEQLLAAPGERTPTSGALSDDQIALAAHACYANTRGLLRDARTLAASSPGRALSLTVLALEEFAKITLLFERRADDPPERWEQFWRKEFPQHRFKQDVGGAYGTLLAAAGRRMYALTLTAPIIEALDRIKQQGFYVDVKAGRAQGPDVFGADLEDALDFLFAAAEERTDSFAQFHHSQERSAWFLGELRRTVRGGTPPVTSAEDVGAVVLSLASRCSVDQPPDYAVFTPTGEEICAQVAPAVARSGVDALMDALAQRLETRTLAFAGWRAAQMLKLCNSIRERLGVPETRQQ